jgi:2-methylcitrate dehydratase PrpD
VAAIGARLLKLTHAQTREALGIAEYFGPRSQIMRGVDYPTMVKDSSNWGAMTGVTSAYLAARGFTGAPALTVESNEAKEVWSDLGTRWLITEQYFKPWPVCRWAQPAVQAALNLSKSRRLDHRRIREVNIETFHGACRLAGNSPTNTHQAQYAIAFPTACAFVRGQVGIDEIAGSGLVDQDVRSLAARIRFTETPEFNAAFPGRRIARLKLVMDDDEILETPATEPIGDPEQPLSDSQIVEKFYAYVVPVFGEEVANRIAQAIGAFEGKGFDLDGLLQVLRRPYTDTYIHPDQRRRSLLT